MMYTAFVSICKLKSLIVCKLIHTLGCIIQKYRNKSNLIKATNFDQLKCCFCWVTLFIVFMTAILMLCPLLSLRPEKAARVNWHLPTVRPEWAPTCESDPFTRVCMLTAETATDQRIAQLSKSQPLSPTFCFSAADRKDKIKDFWHDLCCPTRWPGAQL